MKKIFLISLLSICLVNVKAQLGFRLGGTMANISNNSNVTTDNTFGMNFGAVFNIGSKNLTFKPGILFTQKGYEFSQYDTRLRINYLDVPLNLAYKFLDKIQVEAGPYLGYGLSARSHSGSNSRDVEFSDNGLSNFDGGVNLGVSYYLIPSMQLGLGYNLGLIDIDNSNSGEIRNRYLSLNLTYYLGKKE